jgi:hypothetical protein
MRAVIRTVVAMLRWYWWAVTTPLTEEQEAEMQTFSM